MLLVGLPFCVFTCFSKVLVFLAARRRYGPVLYNHYLSWEQSVAGYWDGALCVLGLGKRHCSLCHWQKGWTVQDL